MNTTAQADQPQPYEPPPPLTGEPFPLEIDFDNLTTQDIEILEALTGMSFFDILEAFPNDEEDGLDSEVREGGRPPVGKVLSALGFLAQRKLDPTVTLATMRPTLLAEDEEVFSSPPAPPAPPSIPTEDPNIG